MSKFFIYIYIYILHFKIFVGTYSCYQSSIFSISTPVSSVTWYFRLGLWRYWIFSYHGEAATNIAVLWLITRPPPPVKINVRGRTCASAWSVAPKRLLRHTAEPQHIVTGIRFHWSHEERHFQQESFVGRADTYCISTSAKVHAAD